MKFYGAGVASSLGEMDNFLKCETIYKLDLETEYPPVEFVVQDVQPFYYYIETFFNLFYKFKFDGFFGSGDVQ